MKRIFKLSFLLVLLVLFMAGCAIKQVTVEDSRMSGGGEYEDAPAWVIEPAMEGGLCALGIARVGPAGMQFARNEAMASGRSELARMISLKVEDLTKNFTRQTGVVDNAVVDKVSEQVSKQVTKQTLAGSRANKLWVSPENNLHILMVLDPKVVKASVKEAVTTSYKNEEALWQQFQAERGYEELDKEIDQEF